MNGWMDGWMEKAVRNMAISEHKTRIAITISRDAAETIKEEAHVLGLTMSQYVYLTMMANSFLTDERMAGLASNELQRIRDVAWGYEVSGAQKEAPGLV